ncbi:MAG: hypothetical protein KJ767_01640 [Nanoarchaeota archaeon]|nr:hypothetical protein [Nanoarchaeota archaeon]
MASKKGILDPLNLIMGIIAIGGAVLVIFNYVNYGLILLIITTLIEAIRRLFG